MRIIVACALALLLPSLASATNYTAPKEFDLACAVTTAAHMALFKDHEARDVAYNMLSFYTGRLSGRDDKTVWSAVIAGRVAELREKAADTALFGDCTKFYLSKMKRD